MRKAFFCHQNQIGTASLSSHFSVYYSDRPELANSTTNLYKTNHPLICIVFSLQQFSQPHLFFYHISLPTLVASPNITLHSVYFSVNYLVLPLLIQDYQPHRPYLHITSPPPFFQLPSYLIYIKYQLIYHLPNLLLPSYLPYLSF